MLAELNIANYAVIDHLRLALGRGFNVLTGETGAGKSIIVDALGFVLGDRADPGVIRAGADRAVVEGIFQLSETLLTALGSSLPEPGDDGTLILAREINSAGRTTCRINGRAVTLRQFAEVGTRLVDVHGQGAHLSLLRVPEQVELVDRYAGVLELRKQLAAAVKALVEVRRTIDRVRTEQANMADRAELLNFQVSEIAAARLEPDEEEALIAERTLQLNAERIGQLLTTAADALEQDDGSLSSGASERTAEAVGALTALEKLDERFGNARAVAESLGFQIEDLRRELVGFRDRIEFDGRRLAEVQERLDAISTLKRKYGPTVEAILDFGDSAARELQSLVGAEESLAELDSKGKSLLHQAGKLAGELSQRRLETSRRLTAAVEEQLEGLGMAGARLAVAMGFEESPDGLPLSGLGFEPRDTVVESGRETIGDARQHPLKFSGAGVDRIEFLISTNTGEPLRPLASVASGGETARLMLAIKGVLSNADSVPTLVFDEIDAGIGGRIGEAVGIRLWSVARGHQVLAVTHLPQIACYGDTHLQVSKVVVEGRTMTRVREVAEGERVLELSNMLGSDSTATRSKAAELLTGAELSRKEV